MVEDISIGNDTEGSEDDNDGNVDLDIWEFDMDDRALIVSLQLRDVFAERDKAYCCPA